jgi:hypothetical protein
MSEASTLQGLVALLLDDWREALKELPISFYLHRDMPNLAKDLIGWGGQRWKRAAGRGIPPPAHAIAKLFERRPCTSLRASLSGPDKSSENSWYCACLLARELNEFGFMQQAADDSSSRGPIWVGSSSSLPRCVSHIILVDPSNGTGSIYRVWQTPGFQQRLELHPLMLRTFSEQVSAQVKGNDSSLIELRTCALDLVLEVLEANMK